MSLTINDKLKKLEELTSEVKDIHPLLKTLIPYLPYIKSYEYTHGAAEFGADFVIAKEDPTLDTINYVGVIVKKGEITLSNYHDAARQITELSLERTYGGGKDTVNITEIWIVSNSKITGPAQKIINKQHSTSKVQFLGGERLVQIIDKHLPAYWDQSSAALTGYLKDLRAKLEETDLKLSLLDGRSTEIFFEPEFRECEKDEYNPNTKRPKSKNIINIYEKIKTNKVTLVEGDPGIGKSKFLRHLAMKLLENCSGDAPIIPIFFTFTEFDEKYERDFQKLLKSLIGESYAELWANKSARFLLVADSLDECKKEHDHLAIFKEFLNGVNSDSRLACISTTRHIDRYAIEEKMLDGVFCAEILPLNSQKIVNFLKQITRDISIPTRILEDIKRSKLFRDLPRSPIAAILLAKILRSEPRDLPSTLPELYNQFIEICVGRWEQQISLKSQKEYKALDAILQRIATYIMDSGAPHLNIDEAKRFYEEYLNQRGYEIDALDFFERTTSRCPIICLLNGKSVFAFKHRSFIEFYYAKYLLKSEAKLSSKALTPYWSHSYYFYIGLMQEPDDRLREFIDLKPVSDIQAYFKYTTLSDLMLAGYSARHEIFVSGISDSALTAASFFSNALRNPDSTSLKNFSAIHLLWLTQYTFKCAYSYDFFKKFFNDAAMAIMEAEEDEEVKTIALFLLDVTLLMNEKLADFKFVSDYTKTIPLTIRLGIGHESQGKKKNDFVKKLDKSMREHLRKDPKFKSDVLKLYNSSLERMVKK